MNELWGLTLAEHPVKGILSVWLFRTQHAFRRVRSEETCSGHHSLHFICAAGPFLIAILGHFHFLIEMLIFLMLWLHFACSSTVFTAEMPAKSEWIRRNASKSVEIIMVCFHKKAKGKSNLFDTCCIDVYDWLILSLGQSAHRSLNWCDV